MREKGNRLVQYVPDYTVFDLETTGISANMDDIIEISAVKVKGGIVQDTFSTLVNPGRHIPAQATKVNGITDQMVSEAPLIREAMTEFLRSPSIPPPLSESRSQECPVHLLRLSDVSCPPASL